MTAPPDKFPAAVSFLLAAATILAVSLGIKHTFGLFLEPMVSGQGWSRSIFGLGMAVQNLCWGLSQPFAGYLADRYGAGRVIAAGAALYALGLALMSLPAGAELFIFSAGVLIGLGQSGVTMPVLYGAIGRLIPARQHAVAMGVVTSAGSLGQFVMVPVALGLIASLQWSAALTIFAILVALTMPLALLVRDTPRQPAGAPPDARNALRLALSSRDYLLLGSGFFVCGFQVVFIAVHLPGYLADQGLAPAVSSTALALIALGNVAGTAASGWLSGRYSKPLLLSAIYLGRTIAIALFLSVPLSPWSVYVFSVVIGLLWLSTVPPTNGIVSCIFGTSSLAMLSGVIFLLHQGGSFLGGWLGGLLRDLYGSYDVVWYLAIVLGIMATLLHLPIRVRPVMTAAA